MGPGNTYIQVNLVSALDHCLDTRIIWISSADGSWSNLDAKTLSIYTVNTFFPSKTLS